jgi:hypothetical protein
MPGCFGMPRSALDSQIINSHIQIGAWMIESPLGRRKSLALSTFITAICCLAFVQVESKTGVVWSTIGVSLASAIMWAVLYGMTPEIFDTKSMARVFLTLGRFAV